MEYGDKLNSGGKSTTKKLSEQIEKFFTGNPGKNFAKFLIEPKISKPEGYEQFGTKINEISKLEKQIDEKDSVLQNYGNLKKGDLFRGSYQIYLKFNGEDILFIDSDY